MSKIVKQFMEENGYSNSYSAFGIRKDYKRINDWTFKSIEEVLDHFRKWMKEKEKNNG